MIGVVVSFTFGEDFDHARIVKIAREAAPRFEGLPGLRSKVFTVDEEGHRAMNVYIWDSEDAAREFFDDALVERVTALYGVQPTIGFVEIAALVENP